ncbi:glutathione peroxidase [Pseudaeromonas sp. ZJS20]|uniref:glutathione peroxidase n=1 Tax=Pseudaeromonas aegiceratis TaxID=3153928 RepID=UPI00390C51BF
MTDLYQFSAPSLQGEPVPLSRYRGQVVLVVNTASRCGFTPQYAGLEQLYRQYADQGLVILGFPCNQFGQQEPGDATAIREQCLLNYGVSFPMFAKLAVKGPEAHPLFGWLTGRLPGWFGREIRWNFTKFLLDRQGRPLQRFAPFTPPRKMEAAIVRALAQP